MKCQSTNREYSDRPIRISRARRRGWGFSDAGFTIIEALVAVFILTVGITGCVVLANQVLSASEVSKNRLIAVNLAQEGIETVRSIRDGNWLAAASWDTGLSASTACGSPTDWEVDYSTISLSDTYDGDYLKIADNGLYGYVGATTTTFQRKITICYPQAYEMKIEVRVYWKTKGTTKNILITEHLYNWNS